MHGVESTEIIMTHALMWFRQDLRCADNRALFAACESKDTAVTALYCITPEQWIEHDVAGVRVDFERRHLAELQRDLDALNIPLVIIQAPRYADLPKRIAGLVQSLGISVLHANRQYEIHEQRRDGAVKDALSHLGIDCHWHEDLCILPPGSVLTQDGRYYTVFTPFKRNWLIQLHEQALRLLPVPKARLQRLSVSDIIPDQWGGLPNAISAETAETLWPVGEAHAWQRLQAFIADDVALYDQKRNYPAINGTSTLSPYLAAGILSARQCLVLAQQAAQQGAAARAGCDVWISELCWRDFYKHILIGFPHVCRHQAFKRETDALPWRHDDALFQAWCEGRTGYPIVDAAMRQLKATGWMHNRLRMIVAMFLSKDLFIDWRWGERHFMQHLIDGDLAANNGGWQWAASTGNDAAPYFRIFNPILQGPKFDPDGEFILRFVPELKGLSGKLLHEPHSKGMSPLFARYPRPIVNHAEAREFTLAQFKALG
jgi:deoxyribodipyrimidine photo-lyase